MSEQKAEYLTDALEMIGIDLNKPKQIIQEISGFVPMFDAVIARYKDETRAAVHGAMWRFCQMEDGVCRASLESIAEMIGVSAATAMRHAEELVKDGYFVDLTPDLRNRPHVYADTGVIKMKSKLDVHISHRNTGISQRNTGISESQLNKVLNKDSNKQERANALLSDMPLEAQIMAGVERVTIPRSQIITNGLRDFFKLTPRWSSKYDREWMQWAIEAEMTAEQLEFAADKWKSDRRFNWGVPTLRGIAEHWLELRGDKDEEPERPEYQKFQAPKDEVYAPPPPRKR